jgi:hypothetical protein
MASQEEVVPVLTMVLAACELALERLREESSTDSELIAALETVTSQIRQRLATVGDAPPLEDVQH